MVHARQEFSNRLARIQLKGGRSGRLGRTDFMPPEVRVHYTQRIELNVYLECLICVLAFVFGYLVVEGVHFILFHSVGGLTTAVPLIMASSPGIFFYRLFGTHNVGRHVMMIGGFVAYWLLGPVIAQELPQIYDALYAPGYSWEGLIW